MPPNSGKELRLIVGAIIAQGGRRPLWIGDTRNAFLEEVLSAWTLKDGWDLAGSVLSD